MAAMLYDQIYPTKRRQSDASTSLVGDSDTASGYEDDDVEELQESANVWILSQQQKPLTKQQTTRTDTGQRRSTEYEHLVTVCPSTSLQSTQSPISPLLSLGRWHSFQCESMLSKSTDNSSTAICQYISQYHKYPLTNHYYSDASMKPSNRRPSIPKTQSLIRRVPLPPPRNGSTLVHVSGPSVNSLAPPLLVSQSSRTSIYSTSDCSSFMYISANPGTMNTVNANPDPTDSSKMFPVRPAPPPPTSPADHQSDSDFASYESVAGFSRYTERTPNNSFRAPFQKETQFCVNSTTRPNLCTLMQPDNYSLYSTSSSISYSNGPFSAPLVNRQKFTRHWLNSVRSQQELSAISSNADDLSVPYPPTYDEIERSMNLSPQDRATELAYDNRTSNRNIYNYPTVLINGRSGNGNVSSQKAEEVENEDEEENPNLVNIASHYDARSNGTGSSFGGSSTQHNNPSPPGTFTTTLCSDMMDPSTNTGIFRKPDYSIHNTKANIKERFTRLSSHHFYDMELGHLKNGKLLEDSFGPGFDSSTSSLCCRHFFVCFVAVLVALLIIATIAMLLYYHCSGSQSDIITFLQELARDNLLFRSLQRGRDGQDVTSNLTATTPTSLTIVASTNEAATPQQLTTINSSAIE